MKIMIELPEEIYLMLKVGVVKTDEILKAIKNAVNNDNITIEEVHKRIAQIEKNKKEL